MIDQEEAPRFLPSDGITAHETILLDRQRMTLLALRQVDLLASALGVRVKSAPVGSATTYVITHVPVVAVDQVLDDIRTTDVCVFGFARFLRDELVGKLAAGVMLDPRVLYSSERDVCRGAYAFAYAITLHSPGVGPRGPTRKIPGMVPA